MESVLRRFLGKKKIIRISAIGIASICLLGGFSSNTTPSHALYDEYMEANTKITYENEIYVRDFQETITSFSKEVTSAESYLNFISKNEPNKSQEEVIDEVVDTDPLSSDILHEEYVNSLDLSPMTLDELTEKYSCYFDHPGTYFYFREKRTVAPDDYEIIENIVLGEISYCSFEQMVAEASLCINIMEQEDTDMYDLVMRPGVFTPRYAEKTMESTEEVTAAIEAAVFGMDFSIGATAACTYDWMDDYNKSWFDTLYLTTKIEDSSFYCDPENVVEENIYYYSDELCKSTVVN